MRRLDEEERQAQEAERRRAEEHKGTGKGVKGKKNTTTNRRVGNNTKDDYSMLTPFTQKERRRIVTKCRYNEGNWF